MRDYGESTKIIWDEDEIDCKHEWSKELSRGGRRKREEDIDPKFAKGNNPYSEKATGGCFCLKCNVWYGQLGLECVSGDTEILTQNGWKGSGETKEGDIIATFNVEKDEIEYQPIERIFKRNYNGEMVRIKNFHIDQLLTPNHRILLKYRTHSGEKIYTTGWQFVLANEVEYKNGIILPVAGQYKGRNSIGKDLAELIGWILSDGTLSTSEGYRITIETGKKRILYLLKKLRIKYSVHKRKEKTNFTNNPLERWYIGFSGKWAKKIRKIIPDKKLTSYLLHLKQKELKRLFDGLCSGQSIYGKLEIFGDSLQILLFHLGMRSVWNEKKQSIEFCNRNTTEVSRINKRKNPKLEPYGISKEKYNGIIWCIKTRNETFVARRNKRIFITGNSTLKLYIKHLLQVTKELKRILKPTGVFFLNHGNSYGGSGGSGGDYNEGGLREGQPKVGKSGIEIQAKCLTMQNYRLILKMIDTQNWILRDTIIWAKKIWIAKENKIIGNAMPSSATDRCSFTYEPVFMLTKNKKYYFDIEELRVPFSGPLNRWGGDVLKVRNESDWDKGTGQNTYRNRNMRPNIKGANRPNVWQINTEAFSEAHFAVFSPKLIEPMILSGCPKEICKKCEKARVRITTGWSDCKCGEDFKPGLILDPFMGSGTVGVVAKKLGRNYLGIELNPEYIKIAEKRLENTFYQREINLEAGN